MMIRGRTGVMLVSAALALGGCARSGGSAPATATPSTPPPHEGGMMGGGMMEEDACPMAVAGTSVTQEDTVGGIALVFTTTGDVAELRARVRSMAEMHGMHRTDGMMMKGEGGGKHRGDMQGSMRMPAAEATVEDVTGGARIVLSPEDPATLDALRAHVRKRAERMAGGECPMMAPDEAPTTPAPDDDTGHADHHPAGA